MKLLGKAISGTCGARTYSVGGAGVTARQKVCPVNKNSLAQARRRGLFAAAGAAFKSLTAEQRAELHARALAASDTDVFGKKITLSDYAFFLREWMRGIRPAPSEDPSIAVLDYLRQQSWRYELIQPTVLGVFNDTGDIPDEVITNMNETRSRILFTINQKEPESPIAVVRVSPNALGLLKKNSQTGTVTSVTYTDILGRVFTF